VLLKLGLLRECAPVSFDGSNHPGKNLGESAEIYLVNILLHVFGQNVFTEMAHGIERFVVFGKECLPS
jgi:hypothetical protein